MKKTGVTACSWSRAGAQAWHHGALPPVRAPSAAGQAVPRGRQRRSTCADGCWLTPRQLGGSHSTPGAFTARLPPTEASGAGCMGCPGHQPCSAGVCPSRLHGVS